jgi:hypothetical protein
MKKLAEKILVWINGVLILGGLFFIIAGIIGENGVLIFVGIVLIVLNVSSLWKYIKKRKTS